MQNDFSCCCLSHGLRGKRTYMRHKRRLRNKAGVRVEGAATQPTELQRVKQRNEFLGGPESAKQKPTAVQRTQFSLTPEQTVVVSTVHLPLSLHLSSFCRPSFAAIFVA